MLIIVGLFIGVIWANLKRVDNNTFKLFGFIIKIEKSLKKQIPDVILFKKKETENVDPIKKDDECDFCHGQDLYINKSIMMCPKCKKNKSRVKSV